MASFHAYPPSVLHVSLSHPLDTSSAHEILGNFLHLANLDPAYRPDSILTENGPQPTSSSGNPNLTLHHLNRIKRGLEGTNLGAEDLDREFFGARPTPTKDHRRKRKWEEYKNRDVGAGSAKAGIPKITGSTEENIDDVVTAQHSAGGKKSANTEGWQDREDFELAQDDEDVDVNNAQRDPAMAIETEGIGQGIMEGETGRMINVDSEVDKEDGAAQTVRASDVIDKRKAEKHGPGAERKRALTQRERDERKRLKKIRSEEERTSSKGQPTDRSKERSQKEKVEREPRSTTTTPIRKKKKPNADVLN